MAVETKDDRKPADAKADAEAAINAGATKITLQRKNNGNWTITITKP
jgi:hypothetical protein